MRAGKIMVLFVRAPVNRKIDKIRPDAAIIQKRIAFGGRTVCSYGLSVPFGVYQKRQYFSLCFLYLFIE